jgi:beta-phosphoglucomutase-like phosphatase (HAD superfamily)
MSAELGLKGKPEPDIFITACERLGASPDCTMIVEDAVSGIQAAVKGHFGLALGIARENNAEELLRCGADIVFGDLSEISIDEIDCWFRTRMSTEHNHRARAQETI